MSNSNQLERVNIFFYLIYTYFYVLHCTNGCEIKTRNFYNKQYNLLSTTAKHEFVVPLFLNSCYYTPAKLNFAFAEQHTHTHNITMRVVYTGKYFQYTKQCPGHYIVYYIQSRITHMTAHREPIRHTICREQRDHRNTQQ